MKSIVKRKPTFPISTAFLSAGEIERVLYCNDRFETYLIKGKTGVSTIGLVIRCNNELEYSEYRQLHMTWWSLKNSNLKVLEEGKIETSINYCYLAAISCETKFFRDEILFNQNQAEIIMRELISFCIAAISQEAFPFVDIGTILIGQVGETYSSMPLFLLQRHDLEKESEQECIKSIATFIYYLITGISLKDIFLNSDQKKQEVSPATRWNKDIDKRFSNLLSSCIDEKSRMTINSLSMLETRLNTGSSKTEPKEGSQIRGETNISAPIGQQKKQRGLDKVAGMKDLKQLLKEEVIAPIKNPEPFKLYGLTIPNGILLYGPPGCGKTFIAKQLAEELNFHFIEIIPSEIASPFIHDSVLKIREIFKTAEENAPSIIFIDEFEALVPARSGLGGHQQYKSEEVNEFLINLNESASKKILIIAATNEPNKIDNAIRRTGRLDKIIYVGPPDLEARHDLLEMYLSHRPLDKVDFNYFAQLLEGYSCSDIQNIANEGARLAMKENKPINTEHLSNAIKRNPSSLTPAILSGFKEFQQRGM